MKQLQNNFTTPEQSKRLLELGVPADSADLYWHPKYRRNEDGVGYWSRPIILEDGHTLGYEQAYSAYFDLLPCWSVGRLMAIYFISKDLDFWSPQFKKYQIENSVEYFVAIIANNIKDLDFSKLEE